MGRIGYERVDHVVLITMEGDTDLNIGMAGRELHERLLEYRDDDDLRCAVIIGAGQRAFSVGGNVKERAERARSDQGTAGSVWAPLVPNIVSGLDLWKPLIAAVNGHAIGMGCMLALACDVRLASENATFGLAEVKLGFPAGGGAPFRLPRLMALGPAMEMLLTGDRITAQQAYHWGLVNKVVPGGDLLRDATALAQRIASNPPLAVRATKEIALRGLEMSFDDNRRLQQSLSYICQQTEDAKEGPVAFAEKRPGHFKGR